MQGRSRGGAGEEKRSRGRAGEQEGGERSVGLQRNADFIKSLMPLKARAAAV